MFAKLCLNQLSTNQRTNNFHNQNILQNGKRAADTFCFRQDQPFGPGARGRSIIGGGGAHIHIFKFTDCKTIDFKRN